MGDQTQVVLRARTDDDFETLFRLASELETWEERNTDPPSPLTRAAYAARLDGTTDDLPGAAAFVIEVDGAPVGTASLFGFDMYAQHAEAGISLTAEAR